MSIVIPSLRAAVAVPGWAKNVLWRNARTLPSLDLRFAENKSLTDAVTGRSLISFTRASSATYIDSAGTLQTVAVDVPRFDHAITASRTNLLLRSEEFNDASWSKVNTTVTANSIAAPNGTVTADTITDSNDASAAIHSVTSQNQSFTSGLLYTVSVYARAGTQPGVAFVLPAAAFTSNLTAAFNISTGSIISFDSGMTGSITAVGGGWYRCTATATATATASSSTATQIRIATASTSFYQGNGTGTISLWGAQLEQSSTVGEYIPTTSTINSAPRFDHNPTTGESLGLLVEEARTNLSQWSEDFSDAYWTKTSCTITSNESTAPDGTLTADLWSNTGTPGVMHNSITKDATARTYTSSLWVKGTLTQLTVSLDDGTTTNRGRVQFNLSTNTVGSIFNEGLFTNTSGTLTQFSNSWVRVTVTTTTSIGTTIRFRPFFSGANSILRIWGAQVEEGAFPTSYIPTTTAAVTRSADVASISGSNFSAWYRSTESTVFANWENLAATMPSGSAQWLAEFSDGTTSNRQSLFQIQAANSLVSQNSFVSGSGAGRLDAGGAYSKIVVKASAAFASLDRALAANGGLATVSSAGNIPIGINRLDVGASLGTAHLNGAIRRLTYWPTRLPNSTLQAVTQ